MKITCVFDNINKLDSSTRATKIPGGECHRYGIWGRKDMKRFRAFIASGVPVRMLADVQTNISSSGMHVQWFSHWKIRADDHDVMK